MIRMMKCERCDGDGKAHGADRPFEWSGPGTYPGPCPVCCGSGTVPGEICPGCRGQGIPIGYSHDIMSAPVCMCGGKGVVYYYEDKS